MVKRAIAIIGAGGFGREVAEYIEDINKVKPTWEHIGFIDDNPDLIGSVLEGIHVWGTTEAIAEQLEDGKATSLRLKDKHGIDVTIKVADVDVVCAIGKPQIKKKIVARIQELGFRFVNVIHPLAYIGKYVTLGEGIIVGPYCVITKNIALGNHVSINPQCGIGHDVTVGEYTSCYWNVNISGNVTIADECELGTKATVLQGLSLGSGSVVGANAVVTKSVNPGTIVAGVPARPLYQKSQEFANND